MTETLSLHQIDTGWREAAAQALEAKALSVTDLLAHIDNVTELAAGDEPLLSVLRQAAGLIRSRRNDLVREAEQLRAAVTP